MGDLVRMAAAGAMAAVFAVGGAAYGQRSAPPPRPLPQAAEPDTLPQAPADRFAACRGIEDRTKREDCIERQTQKGNPATATVPENSGQPAAAPAE